MSIPFIAKCMPTTAGSHCVACHHQAECVAKPADMCAWEIKRQFAMAEPPDYSLPKNDGGHANVSLHCGCTQCSWDHPGGFTSGWQFTAHLIETHHMDPHSAEVMKDNLLDCTIRTYIYS
jgi:hypothetical protein